MHAPSRRPPRLSSIRLRGLDHGLTRWGPESDAPLVLLHGWADSGETFQFMVDAFEEDRAIVALDWRGFGRSAWQGSPYWFPDYLADLDALLDVVSPEAPATLVGHSMGGNIASLYAGVRPERVDRLVNLEGLGLRRTAPAEAPDRYRRWLEQLRSPPDFARFETLERFAEVLRRKNPRLSPERAAFVAAAWSRPLPEGGYVVCSDPAHKFVYPVLYRREEVEACWRRVTAPVLLVFGECSEFRADLGADGSDDYFRDLLSNLTLATLPACGHMLHHDDPDALARIVEPFCRSGA